MSEEVPLTIRQAILSNQLAQYRQSIYFTEITHKIHKRLGNVEKLAELEKDLVRLNKEMDAWQAELDALTIK